MKNEDWEEWVHRLHWVATEDAITTIEWVHWLCKDGIIPLLHRRGYKLICNPSEFANSILNYSYRIYRETITGRYSTYKSSYEKLAKYDMDELEFFEDRKFTNETMNWLKKRYETDYLADEDSDFSNRFWVVLRYIIFVHLDLNKSPASQELYDLMNPPDDENGGEGDDYLNQDEKRKKKLDDPYAYDKHDR